MRSPGPGDYESKKLLMKGFTFKKFKYMKGEQNSVGPGDYNTKIIDHSKGVIIPKTNYQN
jgi:hypothetical protein